MSNLIWHDIVKIAELLRLPLPKQTAWSNHTHTKHITNTKHSVGEKTYLREHVLSCWRTDVIRACRCPAQSECASEWVIDLIHPQDALTTSSLTLLLYTTICSTNTMSVLFWLSKQSWSPKVDVWQSFPEALSTLVKEGVAFLTFEIYALWQWGKSENHWKEKVRRTTIKKKIKSQLYWTTWSSPTLERSLKIWGTFWVQKVHVLLEKDTTDLNSRYLF